MKRVNSMKGVFTANPVSEVDASATKSESIEAAPVVDRPPAGSIFKRNPFFTGLSAGLVVALIIGVVLGVEYDKAKSDTSSSSLSPAASAAAADSDDTTSAAASTAFIDGFNNSQYGMWYLTGQTLPHVFDSAYPIPDLNPKLMIPSETWDITYPDRQSQWVDSFKLIEEDMGDRKTNVGVEFDPFYSCNKCDPTDVTCFSCEPGNTTFGAFHECTKDSPGASITTSGNYICPQEIGPDHGMHMFQNWQSHFQTIQRFQYTMTSRQTSGTGKGVNNQPIYYIEIDYNSEGIARGPGPGSFLQPHFDFHFYVKPWMDVRNQTCTSLNGKPIWGRTCPLLNIPPMQTASFLAIPFQFMPNGWKPDLGSSIPMMGMHSFDEEKLPVETGTAESGSLPYSVENVFTHPPQLVGTYKGQVQFVEASPVVPFLNAMLVEGRKTQSDQSFNVEYKYSTNKYRVYMQLSTFAKQPGVQQVCGDPACAHCTNISGICLS